MTFFDEALTQRITAEARETHFWRTVLTVVAGLLFGLGWITYKTFAALWFGSLGHGGWWVLFAVIGLLVEGPIRSRHRADLPGDASPVRPLVLGTARLLVAGLILSLLL